MLNPQRWLHGSNLDGRIDVFTDLTRAFREDLQRTVTHENHTDV
jgi:hypothetical protein